MIGLSLHTPRYLFVCRVACGQASLLPPSRAVHAHYPSPICETRMGYPSFLFRACVSCGALSSVALLAFGHALCPRRSAKQHSLADGVPFGLCGRCRSHRFGLPQRFLCASTRSYSPRCDSSHRTSTTLNAFLVCPPACIKRAHKKQLCADFMRQCPLPAGFPIKLKVPLVCSFEPPKIFTVS